MSCSFLKGYNFLNPTTDYSFNNRMGKQDSQGTHRYLLCFEPSQSKHNNLSVSTLLIFYTFNISGPFAFSVIFPFLLIPENHLTFDNQSLPTNFTPIRSSSAPHYPLTFIGNGKRTLDFRRRGRS